MRILMFFALLLAMPAGYAQTRIGTVHILVLNAHGGKPVKRARTSTMVYPLSPYTTPIRRSTDAKGDLALLVPTEGELAFRVVDFPPCQHVAKADRKKPLAPVPLATIFASGVVAAGGCRAQHIAPSPGELIVYVRPKHWWEQIRD